MKRLLSAWVLLCAVGGVVAQEGSKEVVPEEGETAAQGKPGLYVDPGTHPAQIREVFFLPDNKHVVTYGKEHTIRLWQVDGSNGGRTIYLPGWFAYNTRHAALSGNGKYLAVASIYPQNKQRIPVIHLLSMPDGRLVQTLRNLEYWASAVAISHDGKRVAAAQDISGVIRLWDLDKGPSVRSLRAMGGKVVKALTFSPDGKRLAWITNEKGRIADLSGPDRKDLPGGYSLAWSPDGKTLAVGRKGEVELLAPDGTSVGTQKFGEEPNHSLVFRADSKAILWNGRVLRDLKSGKDEVAFTGKGYGRTTVGAISPDGELIATVSGPMHNALHIRKTNGNAPIRSVAPIAQLANVGNTLVAAWRSDGKAIAWRGPNAAGLKDDRVRQGAFDFSKLELLPPLKKTVFAKGVITQQDDLTLISGGKAVVKQGEKILAEIDGWAGTFAGKDVVAVVSNRNGDVIRFNAHTGKKLLAHPAAGHLAPKTGISVAPDRRYLLTLHSFGLIQVFSPEQEKALLKLYVQGEDWVAWTPGGYYAASPGGEKLVRWKVSNGIDELPSVYSVDRFRKKLYRPDVVMKAFELGSVAKALVALDGKGAKVAQIDALLPPTVAVKVVEQTGASATVKVTAKARVKSQPIASLRLMLDGMPFPGLDVKKYDTPQAEAEWAVKVKLPPGNHTLGALVRSEDASARAEPVSVEVRGRANLPRLHVLTVGINEYGKDIPRLTCAANDARDLARAFSYAKKGALFAEVVTHKPLTDKDATSKAIRARFLALRKEVNRQDIVVVFFAGHGTRSKGDFYFLTHDSDSAKLGDDNALSGKRLAEALAALGCRVLLLLDAGHSSTANLTPASDDAARGLADDDVGVTVLSAVQGKQKPQGRDGNGLFARAIKEALDDRSAAPRAEDGRMFVHHLYAHVSDRVAKLSSFGQTPYLRLPEGVPPFALRRFDKK